MMLCTNIRGIFVSTAFIHFPVEYYQIKPLPFKERFLNSLFLVTFQEKNFHDTIIIWLIISTITAITKKPNDFMHTYVNVLKVEKGGPD